MVASGERKGGGSDPLPRAEGRGVYPKSMARARAGRALRIMGGSVSNNNYLAAHEIFQL